LLSIACRAFGLRCLRTLAGTLGAALWRHYAGGASVLVVQLCEAVRGSVVSELAGLGVEALQAVAEASVASIGSASLLHSRLGPTELSQREDAVDAVATALGFLLHELQGPEHDWTSAAKAFEAGRSSTFEASETRALCICCPS
jgi:hypothetical protein